MATSATTAVVMPSTAVVAASSTRATSSSRSVPFRSAIELAGTPPSDDPMPLAASTVPTAPRLSPDSSRYSGSTGSTAPAPSVAIPQGR